MKPAGTGSLLTRRMLCRWIVALASLYLLLLIPAPEPATPPRAKQTPFAWNRDAFWSSLETQFKEARAVGCDGLGGQMNYRDHARQFCSEVAAAAYERVGVELWMGISHISSRGVASWLSAFGAKHFETQEPSDLEYDPQLRVVAEWRDPRTLFKDHADNATTDVMLEDAELQGRPPYSRLMLPFARMMKAYSAVLNLFGRVGPVPEGMSATAALRHKAFSRRHEAIRGRLVELADGFKRRNGYPPPYWALVELARKARAETGVKS